MLFRFSLFSALNEFIHCLFTFFYSFHILLNIFFLYYNAFISRISCSKIQSINKVQGLAVQFYIRQIAQNVF